jgi:hypothetical protein
VQYEVKVLRRYPVECLLLHQAKIQLKVQETIEVSLPTVAVAVYPTLGSINPALAHVTESRHLLVRVNVNCLQ